MQPCLSSDPVSQDMASIEHVLWNLSPSLPSREPSMAAIHQAIAELPSPGGPLTMAGPQQALRMGQAT